MIHYLLLKMCTFLPTSLCISDLIAWPSVSLQLMLYGPVWRREILLKCLCQFLQLQFSAKNSRDLLEFFSFVLCIEAW